jgi:hypothetical protein
METAVHFCRFLGSKWCRPRDSPDILNAGFSAKDRTEALDPLKSDTAYESLGWYVPSINDGDDPTDISVIEDEADHLSHGFGAQAGILRTRCHGEADLGLLPIGRGADADITNQFVGGSIRDPKLDPGATRKEAQVAHVLDKPRRLVVGLRLPSLELAHGRVTPIGLKSGEIDEFEPPQHDAAGTSRKLIRPPFHFSLCPK